MNNSVGGVVGSDDSRVADGPAAIGEPAGGDICRLIHEIAAVSGTRPPRFAPDALAYLQREARRANVRTLRNFVARAAAIVPGREIDEALAALLLHGERRNVDRWLNTATRPLPMPNRRRPPPIVAAEEVVDLPALLNDLEHAYVRDALGATAGIATTARLLGLRRATPGRRTPQPGVARTGRIGR